MSPSDFVRYKSVLWPSKNAKIRFWPGLCPEPGEADDAPPDSYRPSRLGEDPYPYPPQSAPSTHLRRTPCAPPHFPAYEAAVATRSIGGCASMVHRLDFDLRLYRLVAAADGSGSGNYHRLVMPLAIMASSSSSLMIHDCVDSC